MGLGPFSFHRVSQLELLVSSSPHGMVPLARVTDDGTGIDKSQPVLLSALESWLLQLATQIWFSYILDHCFLRRKLLLTCIFKLAVIFQEHFPPQIYCMPVINVLVAKKSSLATSYYVCLKSLCNNASNLHILEQSPDNIPCSKQIHLV